MTTVGKQFDDKYTGIRVSRDELLNLIEENNGPEGLDLSGKDLSGIKLSKRVLEKIRSERGLNDSVPVWLYSQTGGINLQGTDLSWAKLSDADLSRCCLRGADLRGARLDHVDLIEADLRDAILWDAILDGAVLDGAMLHGANIFGANFFNSTFRKECFGHSVIQESKSYKEPPGIDMREEWNRYWQGSRIYRTLKAAFDSAASFKDASWAYRRARRMEKHLAAYHTREAWHNRDWRQLVASIWKWVSDQIVEKLCDYGENSWLVLLWIVILWLGFAALYGVIGGVQLVTPTGISKTTYNLLDILSFSLATMTTNDPVGLMANNSLLIRFLMPLQTLLAIALTGLFGFVLGNRINRV